MTDVIKCQRYFRLLEPSPCGAEVPNINRCHVTLNPYLKLGRRRLELMFTTKQKLIIWNKNDFIRGAIRGFINGIQQEWREQTGYWFVNALLCNMFSLF